MTERTGRGGEMRLGTAALRGAAAAMVGGVAMKLAWEIGERTLQPRDRLGSPTEGAVDALAGRAGVELTAAQRTAGSLALFMSAMATWGAIFGMVHSRVRPPAVAHGLVLGGLLYTANFSKAAALPKAGIVPSFGEQRGRQRTVPLAAHAVFGVTTAVAFEAMS